MYTDVYIYTKLATERSVDLIITFVLETKRKKNSSIYEKSKLGMQI